MGNIIINIIYGISYIIFGLCMLWLIVVSWLITLALWHDWRADRGK